MPYRLQELIDGNQLQSFLDSFSGVSGIAAAIVARDGSVVAASGWEKVCLNYHRAHPESLRCCIDSNVKVAGELEQKGGIIRYTCPHGFVKAAFALAVDGEHLGTMFTGQMLLEKLDEEHARATARRYGFDQEGYLAALRAVPVITPHQLENNLDCLQKFTDLIVGMANGARREKVNFTSSALLARRYASILETTADGFWILDGQGRCLEANEVCAANLGYSLEELRGMSLRDIDGGETTEEMAARTAAIKGEGFGRFEAVHRRKDGTLMEVEVSTSYIVEEGLFIAFIRDISTRKQSARQLNQARDFLDSIINAVSNPLFVKDREHRIILANDADCALIGRAREEIIGRTDYDFFPREQADIFWDKDEEVLTTGLESINEELVSAADGSSSAIIAKKSRCTDAEGNHFVVGTLTDITPQKQAEEALRQSEQRFRNLFERAPVPYQSIDIDGRLQEVNEAWCRMLGYERQEVIGTWLGTYLSEHVRPLLQERLSLLVQGGSVTGVDCQFVRKNGLPVDVIIEGNVSRDSDGRFERTHCILIDVSERLRAEEAVQASQKRLQFLLTATPAVIYTCRASGDFGATFISDNVSSLMGYEPQRFLEDTGFWLEHIHPDDRSQVDAALAALAAHGHHSHEYRFRTSDGGYRWMHDEVVLVRDGEGNPHECIGCWLDVTDRRQAEEEIRLLNEQLEQRVAERTAELESFCYSISHDLRAPLRAIDGFTRILREEYEPCFDDLGKDLCSRISGNAVRMGSLIDDLLAFSRTGRTALEPQQLDMAALARSAFEELLPTEKLGQVELQLEELPVVVADRATLHQVWINLLDNALKYSSREPHAVIKVGGLREGDKVVYFVRDNGVGFNMDYANKLFGVFLRAHSPAEFPGTGVGLAIVERIIHRHGGRVWAEGEVGKGATFFFSLPA